MKLLEKQKISSKMIIKFLVKDFLTQEMTDLFILISSMVLIYYINTFFETKV